VNSEEEMRMRFDDGGSVIHEVEVGSAKKGKSGIHEVEMG